ncbi:cytochrome P450 [Hypoxylon argillaceum]|nr:cytochrome P450 [Hypoxylon argillaceum]
MLVYALTKMHLLSPLVAFLAVVISWLFLWNRRARVSAARLGIPSLQFEGDNSPFRYASEMQSLMDKGYNQYLRQGLPFSIRNPTDPKRRFVILPMKYLEEVRTAPESLLSFPLFLEKANLLKEIGGPSMNSQVTHMARVDMNRALSNLVPLMYEACVAAMQKVLPPCSEWTAITPYESILQIFSRTTARMLVGSELCQSDEWITVALEYTSTCLSSISSVRERYSPSLRWLARYTSPDVKKAAKLHQRAVRILKPHLEARLRHEIETDSSGGDAIQWLISVYENRGLKLTPDQLAYDELLLTVASIHSSSATALATLLDLITYPESLAEIRDEIARVNAKHGTWTRNALGDLRILDSFMTESMRLHSVAQLTMQRYAASQVTFKDGLRIPAGTQISFANHQVNLDSDLHPQAEHFDPKRALRKREQIDSNKFHFASVSDDAINFGSGFHACPGRFLAQEALKMMFIHLLMNYDLKFPDESTVRPPDIKRNFNSMPNFKAPILFRERGFT